MDYPYEKVKFTFYFLFRVEGIFLKRQKTPEVSARDFLASRKMNETLPATEDDFSPSKTYKGDLVTIEWKDRKCVGR